MRWFEDTTGELRRWTIRRDDLVVTVLPELGAKIETLALASSGRNVLLSPPEFPLRRARPGALFEDYDTSGWDECFPTVSACVSPDDGETLCADHGDLWSIPWALSTDGDTLLAEAQARSVPCRFRRRLAVRGATLRVDYEILSDADRTVDVLWSAHPLLAVTPGSRIHLPYACESLRVESSLGERLGRAGDRCTWPDAGHRRLDLVGSPASGAADKLFTDRLGHGSCALHDRASDESVTFRFDPSRVPHVGVWLSQGGWPTSRRRKHYTVALEPCLAPRDSLSEAAAHGEALRLAPRASFRFWLEVELRKGAPL